MRSFIMWFLYSVVCHSVCLLILAYYELLCEMAAFVDVNALILILFYLTVANHLRACSLQVCY